MEIACPVAMHLRVQQAYMTGVDLNVYMTSARKDLKQLRWHFRVFLKMIMMVTFDAFFLKKFDKTTQE